MKTSKITTIAAGISILHLTPCQGASSLILNNDNWNGIILQTEVRAGFRQAGGVAGVASEVAISDTSRVEITPGFVSAGETLYTTSDSFGTPFIDISSFPDAGRAKDIAQGSLTASFTVGSETANDQFNFDLDTLTSAELAQVDFGSGLENADAFFEATITLSLWAPARIPGAMIETPDLPNLINPVPSVETLNASYVNYIDGVFTTNTFGPGDSGEDVEIYLSEFHEKFEYVLTYSIVTPYGTDPITTYSIQGGAAAIPEPTSLIFALGSVGLFFRRRR